MTGGQRKNMIYLLCFCITAVLVFINLIHPVQDKSGAHLVMLIIAIITMPFFLKFFLYMLLAPWYNHITMLRLSKHYAQDFHPRVSVIIPAWNEEIGIVNTIKSVAANVYDNFEIIVINDGSTDQTDSRVKEFLKSNSCANTPAKIVYRYQQNGGKASALNRGITIAGGDIIITIDADCIVSSNMISSFIKYFQDPRVMSVAGNIKVGNTGNLIGTIQHLEYLVSFYMKKVESLLNSVFIVGGAAAAYRREVFRQVGLFNCASITEDIEMSMRILEAGYRIHYADDALVYTEGADNLAGLVKQRLRWKRGRFQAFYTFRKMFFSRRREHNKFLTCFILPFSILGEIKLLFESGFLLMLFLYSFFSMDYTALLMCAIISSSVFLVKALFISKSSHLNLFPFVFIGWLLFYLATFVEHAAVLKTLWCIIRKQSVQWQVWQRKGVFEDRERTEVITY